jgi:hypothetical protein
VRIGTGDADSHLSDINADPDSLTHCAVA